MQEAVDWDLGLQTSRRGPATHLLMILRNMTGLLPPFIWSMGWIVAPAHIHISTFIKISQYSL